MSKIINKNFFIILEKIFVTLKKFNFLSKMKTIKKCLKYNIQC